MPIIEDETRHHTTPEEEREIAAQVEEESPVVVLICARVAYALVAVAGSYIIGREILMLPIEKAKEIALLNGGVAYYTHEAAGKVVSAIDRLYAVGTRRMRR